MNDIYEANDWTKGKPKISGSYLIKSKSGVISRDDYSKDKDIWWHYDVEYYSPSSYREL